MGKLMIFCTCTEYKKEHYLKRVSSWYHNLRAIQSLQPMDPDLYVFVDGVVSVESIKEIDESLLNDPKLHICNLTPMLGRLSDLTFPGWVRSFKQALRLGLEQYDHIVHIENDVLLLHPDKIVSYFQKPGMFCSYWKGRDIIDSTVLVMNDKSKVRNILAFLDSKDDANNMLIEGVLTPLGGWSFVFDGDRLNAEMSHLSMDLDFISQIWRSEVRNPYSAVIMDNRINHIFVTGGNDLRIPNQKHYIGIQCSAITTEKNESYLQDNNGDDNIADRYDLYGPLTALYWIWKHHHTISEETGVGFFCDDMWLANGLIFRPNCKEISDKPRHIYTDICPLPYDSPRDRVCNPEYTFDHHDIVIARKQVQFKGWEAKNVIGFMVSEFGYEFYSEVESILREKCYDYAYDVWKDYAMDIIAPQTMRPLFIMPWKNVKRYCELLFTVCFEMERRFGKEKLLASYYGIKMSQPNQDTQVFKRLAVYLLNLFIYRNKLVAREISVLHFTKQGYNYEQPFSS